LSRGEVVSFLTRSFPWLKWLNAIAPLLFAIAVLLRETEMRFANFTFSKQKFTYNLFTDLDKPMLGFALV
jgi:hypothetical protein